VATPYQFGEFEGGEQTRPAACMVCETMLPEAVDGLLNAEEQRAFDTHVAGCVECSRELAEAQRGAAWLGMLKTKSPEPPATLLARILAETTGAAAHATAAEVEAAPAFVSPAFVPTYDPMWAPRVAPTPAGVWAARWASLRQMSGWLSFPSP
jgi:anti-sigma factor RsiW